MITLIFFSIMLGTAIALIVGTLGEEIQNLLTRLIDSFSGHKSIDSPERQLQRMYQDSVRRNS